MKTLLQACTFCALLLTGFGRENAEQPVVILYEYPDYQGGWLVLPAGDDLGQTEDLYFSNGHRLAGHVGSIEVGRGVHVTLSSEPGFRGAALQLNMNLPDLQRVEANGFLQSWTNIQSIHSTFDREEWYRSPVVVVVRDHEQDEIIRRSFHEIIGRNPEEQDLLVYRGQLRQPGWNEQRLREEIRHSAEFRDRVANRIIERAYREVLGRSPDARDLDHYRNQLIDKGMSEEGLYRDLRRSEEYRGPVVNRMIARAYQELLGRAPDAAGLDHYRNQLIDKGMSEQGMREDLMRSDEYKRRHNGGAPGRRN